MRIRNDLPPMREGTGGGVQLDVDVHERPTVKPQIASDSPRFLSPASFGWRQGVDACKEAADQELPPTPSTSTSPQRPQLRFFSTESKTTTVQEVHDNITKIQKEPSDIQAELDKVVYLLKVADSVGEAARKWYLKPREANPEAPNGNPRAEAKKTRKKTRRGIMDVNILRELEEFPRQRAIIGSNWKWHVTFLFN
ncbi:hypothetical protein ACQ4PT_016943 [Festuca glaucescens]